MITLCLRVFVEQCSAMVCNALFIIINTCTDNMHIKYIMFVYTGTLKFGRKIDHVIETAA